MKLYFHCMVKNVKDCSAAFEPSQKLLPSKKNEIITKHTKAPIPQNNHKQISVLQGSNTFGSTFFKNLWFFINF